MESLIKEIYWQFYPERIHYAKETERLSCNLGQLKQSLNKHQCKLLLNIMDANDQIIEDTGVDKFSAGFRYGIKLMSEIMLQTEQ